MGLWRLDLRQRLPEGPLRRMLPRAIRSVFLLIPATIFWRKGFRSRVRSGEIRAPTSRKKRERIGHPKGLYCLRNAGPAVLREMSWDGEAR